jgi:hypothetical protein
MRGINSVNRSKKLKRVDRPKTSILSRAEFDGTMVIAKGTAVRANPSGTDGRSLRCPAEPHAGNILAIRERANTRTWSFRNEAKNRPFPTIVHMWI